MADDLEKQPHANGATTEPPLHSPRRRRRRGYRFSQGCECCFGLGCLRALVVVAATAIVLTGFAITIFCIIINPHEMKFHVTDASLTKFDYITSNKTLDFKLLLNVTIRNPNKRIGIHFKYSVDQYAYYESEFLGNSGTFDLSFYLPPRAVGADWSLFEGSRTVSFDSREVKRLFNQRKRDGVFPFYVKVKMTNSFKVDKMHIGDFRSQVKCRLKVPLRNSTVNGKSGLSSGTIFKDTKCDYHFNPFPIIYSE